MTDVARPRPRSRALRIAVALVAACLLALVAAPAAGALSVSTVAATPTATTGATPAADTNPRTADGTPATTTTPAATPKTTLEEVEKELMCSTCRVPLAQSDAPQAQQERQTIERLIAEGRTKDEIIDEMVLIYSETVLIDPPEANVRTLRWLVPAIAALLGFSLVAFLVIRWRRSTRMRAHDEPADPTAGWADAPKGSSPADDVAAPGDERTGDLSDDDRARLDADLDRYA